MSARPFAALARLAARLDAGSSDDERADLVAALVAEARRVLPLAPAPDEAAWVIEECDDYGVWEAVAVVLGPAERAEQLVRERAGDLVDNDDDDEPRVSFERIELLR